MCSWRKFWFDQRSSTVIEVDMMSEDPGRIKWHSSGSIAFFGFDGIGGSKANIRSLIPPLIAPFHNSFFLDYLNGAESRKLYSTSKVHFRTPNGFTQERAVSVKPLLATNSLKMHHLAYIQREPFIKARHFITDQLGFICAISEEASELFGIPPLALPAKGNPGVSVFPLMPGLLDIYYHLSPKFAASFAPLTATEEQFLCPSPLKLTAEFTALQVEQQLHRTLPVTPEGTQKRIERIRLLKEQNYIDFKETIQSDSNRSAAQEMVTCRLEFTPCGFSEIYFMYEVQTVQDLPAAAGALTVNKIRISVEDNTFGRRESAIKMNQFKMKNLTANEQPDSESRISFKSVESDQMISKRMLKVTSLSRSQVPVPMPGIPGIAEKLGPSGQRLDFLKGSNGPQSSPNEIDLNVIDLRRTSLQTEVCSGSLKTSDPNQLTENKNLQSNYGTPEGQTVGAGQNGNANDNENEPAQPHSVDDHFNKESPADHNHGNNQHSSLKSDQNYASPESLRFEMVESNWERKTLKVTGFLLVALFLGYFLVCVLLANSFFTSRVSLFPVTNVSIYFFFLSVSSSLELQMLAELNPSGPNSPLTAHLNMTVSMLSEELKLSMQKLHRQKGEQQSLVVNELIKEVEALSPMLFRVFQAEDHVESGKPKDLLRRDNFADLVPKLLANSHLKIGDSLLSAVRESFLAASVVFVLAVVAILWIRVR